MLSKNVKSFLVSDTLSYSASSLISVFLTFLISDKITHGRIDIVGFLIAYYMLTKGAVGIYFSKKLDIKSTTKQKHLVTGSHVLYGVLIALMGFSTTIIHIALILTLLGFLDDLLYPLKWDIFSKILDKGKETYELSLQYFFTAIAAAITAAVGGFLGNRVGLETVFTIFGVFYVLSGIAFYQIITEHTLIQKIRSII
ncbi:MFS transporter [bacterium]|nr:MFS transporter [bacterium]